MQHEVKVPVLAESISEARLLNWHKQVGDPIRSGESLVDIETDKVTLEVSAPVDGVLVEIHKSVGESVSAQEVIAVLNAQAIEPAGEALTAAAPAQGQEKGDPKAPASSPQGSRGNSGAPETLPKMSPAVRALIEQHQLDAAQIPASGKGNRLLKEDVQRYLQAHADSPVPAEPKTAGQGMTAPTAAVPAPLVEPAGSRVEEREPLSILRRRIAERLLQAQQQNAILSTFNEVNMRPIMLLRQRYGESFEKRHGVRLGFMSLFTKAVIEGLRRFPVLNASVEGDDIVHHRYHDIGIALSAPRGLVVPVLRNAELLSLSEIESCIRTFGNKAKEGTLAIEDLTGGTFTITNGGVFGSLLSTPIINPPQSAILGMHKIQERPMAEGGKVLIRPMMYLAVSYDHRIVDGREAVQFLVAVKEQLEDPVRMMLEV